MLVYGKCECFVMQMVYVCVLCASCGSHPCCVLHDLQFVNGSRMHEATIWKRHTPELVSGLPYRYPLVSLLFTPAFRSSM